MESSITFSFIRKFPQFHSSKEKASFQIEPFSCKKNIFNYFSRLCIKILSNTVWPQRPPLGRQNSGRCWQVVVVQRLFMWKKTKMGSQNSGRYRQVVAIRRLLLSLECDKNFNLLNCKKFGKLCIRIFWTINRLQVSNVIPDKRFSYRMWQKLVTSFMNDPLPGLVYTPAYGFLFGMKYRIVPIRMRMSQIMVRRT